MVLTTARRLVVLVIGGSALLLGVFMLVMPGPGIAAAVLVTWGIAEAVGRARPAALTQGTHETMAPLEAH